MNDMQKYDKTNINTINITNKIIDSMILKIYPNMNRHLIKVIELSTELMSSSG